jgi:L-2,4-diaminobutyrate decarboxylase
MSDDGKSSGALPAPFGPHDGPALERFSARLTAELRRYLETIRKRPVRDWKPGDTIKATHHFSPSQKGGGMEALIAGLHAILDDSTHLQHPKYVGHQVSAPIPAAALIGMVEGIINQGMAVGEMSPSLSTIEARLIAWMGALAGLPEDCSGYFTSGGSEANLVGLLAARNARAGGAIWTDGAKTAQRPALLVSSHGHYSINRAVGILGLGTKAIRQVPVNEKFRMTAAAARVALDECRRDGAEPFCLVAAAGCTPVGAIDELEGIGELCAAEGLWFHVDGAHGASLLLSEKLAPRLAGISRADTLAWDPHKMMSMPLGMGAVIARDRQKLLDAYRQDAPYIFHPEAVDALPNPGEISLTCSRPGDALKLWGVLELYGSKLFAEIIERQCGNARALHDLLQGSGDFIPLHEPDSNILCFQHRPKHWAGLNPEELGQRNYRLHTAVNHSGEAWVTSTVLGGQRVLRMTLMNAATTTRDLEEIIAAMRKLGEKI